MRRIVLSLIVAGSAAMLAACGGGGTAFSGNTNSIDRVIITGTGALQGVAKVAPGGQILLSAQGVRGPANTAAGDNIYTWSASYAPAGTPAQNTETGTQVFCNGLTAAGTVFPAANLNVNGANAAQMTLIAPAASPPVTAAPGASSPAPAGSYCLNVNATHAADGKVGSIVVIVTNAP